MLERKDIILYRAQEALGLKGSDAADKYLYGIDVDSYVEEGQWIIKYLKGVDRGVGQVEDYVIDRLLGCLIEFSDIQDIPLSAPTVVQKTKPNIVEGSALIGPQGPKGDDGSNANITVVSNISTIGVQETGDSTNKTITLVDATYIAPTINVNITSSKVLEIGSSSNVNFQIESTIGSESVASRAITSPAGFNLTNNNFDDTEAFVDLAVTSSKTYSAEINDGINTVSNSESLQFVYPILWGFTIDATPTYSDLTKILTVESDQSVAFDSEGGDGYYSFAYPASYGDLASILDLHGDEVLPSFTKSTYDITSIGLASNWTVSYNVYTLGLTDLSSTVTFKF